MYALRTTLLLLTCLLYQLPSIAQTNTEKPTHQSEDQKANGPQSGTTGKGQIAEGQKHNDATKTEDIPEKRLYHRYMRATIWGVVILLLILVGFIIQTVHTIRAVQAAEKSANAVVASERAWIKVDITSYIAWSGMNPPPHLPFIWIRPVITNFGRTPAKITSIYGRTHRIPKSDTVPPESAPKLPEEPDYTEMFGSMSVRETILPPTHDITWFAIYTPREIEDIKARKEFLYVYGYVDYVDVGGHQRQTRFCKLYWIPYGIGDPIEEGFIESDMMPPAYTKST
jgi:hypothetical protein